MLSRSPRRTLFQRASVCQPSRARPTRSRRASRPSGRLRACARASGLHGCAVNQPRREMAYPLPSRWLVAVTARMGLGVGRLLAIARRELSAALVPVPER
jgi:hypothetical protein